jgi:hypothetical protein
MKPFTLHEPRPTQTQREEERQHPRSPESVQRNMPQQKNYDPAAEPLPAAEQTPRPFRVR